ncbi:META domain-containing protein [Cyanobium sp. CH-040]|uniref:META domain-containing protein n=1 Tax=Cyanobium sp. CH-040 TaxID=2823708 RepID=UPI0020CECD32|nr:META domain-containing protein [Cyanobium sp. CH-040]MCP9926571.1 META domain-containing protein [Cyanobium sp. CH-040]
MPLQTPRHRPRAARVHRSRHAALPTGLALGLLLLGAAMPARAEKAKPAPKALGPLPASWVGDIPGASGPVRWHVDLEADGTYQLRQTYLNRDPERGFDDIGRWQLDADGRRLVLRGGREAPVFLKPLRRGRQLRKLDLEGRPVRSRHNDRLARLSQPAPIDPRLHLAGLFRYMADAPSIQLCATGRTLPVAMDADYLKLERAYLQTRAAGAPRLVNLEGLITTRPSMEGGQPPVRTLVVERLVNLHADQTACPGGQQLPLRGTSWRLDSLSRQGRQERPPAGGRPVELLFDTGSDRVSGSGGCNRLMGGFSLDGKALRFSPLASTRMACGEPVMAFEMNVLRALEQVRGWRIEAGELFLLDAGGSTLLRYRASSTPASAEPAAGS